jgi:hypothetical protein
MSKPTICSLAVSAIFLACIAVPSPAKAGFLDRITIDVGKTIEKSVQDTGKAIEKGVNDAGHAIEKPTTIEHAPSDPCKTNPGLPQCKDLQAPEK